MVTKTTEVKKQDEELTPPELLKSEVNFLIYPFFLLSKPGSTKQIPIRYENEIKRGDKQLKVVWEVNPSSKYGSPGPFDRKVHKAIEEIITKQELPIENPITLNISEICHRIGINVGGWQYKRIKRSLKRIKTASIESQGTFFSKSREAYIEDIFNLYDRIVFKGEKLPEGSIASTNYLFLSDWYLENINALYIRPLDYTYYRTLNSSIAQRLYELLGVKFCYVIKHNVACINYRYSTLCQLLPLTRQAYRSYAERQLEPAHKELQQTGFLSKIEWAEIPDTKNWLLTYYPGSRAKDEVVKDREKIKQNFEDISVNRLPASNDEEALVKSLTGSMLEVLEDEENWAFYRKLASRCLKESHLESLIFRTLSETKEAAQRGVIKTTKGAYFTDLIKRHANQRGIDLGLKSG